MSTPDRSGTRGEGAGTGVGEGADRPAEVSFIHLLNALLRHWRTMVGAPLVVALLLVLASVLSTGEFTATGTFLPQDQDQQISELSGIASQIGMSLPMSISGGRSPAFYADLIRSENLLEQVVTHRYSAASAETEADSTSDGADLVEFFEVEGRDRPLRVARAVEALRERITSGSDTETGVVRLSVTTRRPELSKQVADRIVELVNVFNLERRRSQAQAEREFLEERVEEARADLAIAEDSLENFLEHNRSYRNSPTLRFRYQDLQRQVDMEQQVYTSLMQSLQEARIEEVRTTPVITVVEPPQVPAMPDGRSLLLVAVFGLVVGELGAVAWALGDQYFRAVQESEPEEYARFRELRERIAADLRGLWDRVRWRG